MRRTNGGLDVERDTAGGEENVALQSRRNYSRLVFTSCQGAKGKGQKVK